MYTSNFFIVPSHVLELPEITLSFIRFYETIFQFWNHGKPCFLSNSMIKERTGIKSDSTINEAFEYFEEHNEMKRVTENSQRYIVRPEQKISISEPVDNFEIVDKPLAVARGGSRYSERGGLAVARHKIKNINSKNINKNKRDFHKYKKNTNELKCNVPDYKPIEEVVNREVAIKAMSEIMRKLGMRRHE